MTIRRLGLSIAALAAVCPAVSQAWPARASLDACISAFEKTLAQFKVVYGREQYASSIADYFPTTYTFELQADNVKTGEVLARVRCEADRRGIVALSALPLVDARETARVAQR
jgi:hypothetical protein